MQRNSLWVAVALALAAPLAQADDLKALREEVAQLKKSYEDRIAALEKRLADAEARPATTAASAPVVAGTGQVGAGSAFNPQISLILDGVYFRDNKGGGSTEMYEHIDGINHSHEHEGHAHGELERGFNLRETELAFSATVSPHFDATALMTVSRDGDVELEEAYFDTRSLPYGLKVRGGKFLSGIGYLNAQHPHQWDFVDQNLPYRTLLGEHGLVDTGLRLSWLPKTGNWFTQLGVEFLQGNEQTFASSGEEIADVRADGAPLAGTAAGELAGKKSGPRLTTVFAKFGPDLGINHALQFGGWVARSSQHQEVHDHSAENPVALVTALQGKGKAWGLDAVYKYDAGRYGGQGNVKLVGEYLRLNKDLKVAFHEGGTLVGTPFDFVQDGFVVQGTYGFLPYWQAGVRYDATGLTNKVDMPSGSPWKGNKSDRWTFALTRHIDHFSLLRLQASRGNLWVEGAKENANQIFLQYQHSLGAHGAHSF
ncbi:MAG: carbohydrate porin [Rhodocyclaceae bacterium]|nr:carbohydrate porin [Rhodocyclaceae bacterium]